MRTDEKSGLFRSAVLALCFGMLLLSFSNSIPAQTRNWWTLNDTEVAEKGKFKELLTKKKVYVNVSFSDARSNAPVNSAERNDIIQAVRQAISLHKDLKMVPYPEEADFAILVKASMVEGRGPNFSLLLDPDSEVSIEVSVLVPGVKQEDGPRPRVVWEASSPNAQIEAASAARFTVDGFLWELKKLKAKK